MLRNQKLDTILNEDPYYSKVEESGCTLEELEEIYRYLHKKKVSIGVDSQGTYYIQTKSSKKSSSARTYKLLYQDYNAWLGTNNKPKVKLGKLGKLELPLE